METNSLIPNKLRLKLGIISTRNNPGFFPHGHVNEINEINGQAFSVQPCTTGSVYQVCSKEHNLQSQAVLRFLGPIWTQKWPSNSPSNSPSKCQDPWIPSTKKGKKQRSLTDSIPNNDSFFYVGFFIIIIYITYYHHYYYNYSHHYYIYYIWSSQLQLTQKQGPSSQQSSGSCASS